MTIRSGYWDGHTVGHAIEAPYSSQKFMSVFFQTLLVYDRRIHGVVDTGFPEYPGGFQVTGAAGSVNVASGVALVDGEIVLNDAAINVLIPTPAALTRIDRIVLRKRYAPNGVNPQTVEVARIAGVEGGAAPAITQDTTSTTFWDIKLAQVSITVGGVITITSEAEAVRSPLGPGYQEGLFTGVSDVAWAAGSYQDISTGVSIVIGPGKWVVHGGVLAQADAGNPRARIYDNTAGAAVSHGYGAIRANGEVATIYIPPRTFIASVVTQLKLQYYPVNAINDIVYGDASGLMGTSLIATRVI